MVYEIIVALAVITISLILYIFVKYKFSYWRKRGVPSIPATLPFGNLGALWRGTHIAYLSEKFYYEFKGKHPYGGIYYFLSPVAFIADLNLLKNVLIKDFNYFQDRGFFYNEHDDPISAHLFSLDGPKWKIMRNKLSPTFTSGKMKQMFPKVIHISTRFHEVLAKSMKVGEDIDIKDVLARFTTDVIGCCAFGVECNSMSNPMAEFRVESRKVFDNPFDTELLRVFKAIYPKFSIFLKRKAVEKDVSDFFHNIVRQTVDYRQNNNINSNDFMDLLMQLKQFGKLVGDDTTVVEKIDEEEMISQAFLFFVAGFETSSTTSTFALYELAHQHDIQDRCRDEIIEVLKRHDGKLTYESISEMTYVDQVFSEALRKYPALPYVSRKSVQDYKVPETNDVIEKGTMIHLPIYAIQHDPEYYPDPDRFDPERFSPEQVKTRPQMTFLPFGDGPRNCIGLRFAKMQSKIALIILLKNYKFDKCPKTIYPVKYQIDGIVLSPESGVHLKVEKVVSDN